MSDKEPVTIARRFLALCFALFSGVVLLYLTMWLLSQFWGWLLLVAVAVAAIWLLVRLLRARRDRW